MSKETAITTIPENLYSKLQSCRVELSRMNLKKSGKNTFTKFRYYELSDFLPSVMQLFEKYKLFSKFSDYKDTCTLEIINSENPTERETFTSENADATVKGSTPIQSRGALQTYQRRYLYYMAMEFVEADVLDNVMNANEVQSNSGLIDYVTANKFADRMDSAGFTPKQIDFLFNKFKIETVQDLPMSQVENFRIGLESIEKKILEHKQNGN